MSKTFLVTDKNHPLFGTRVNKFDGRKSNKWPSRGTKSTLTDPNPLPTKRTLAEGEYRGQGSVSRSAARKPR